MQTLPACIFVNMHSGDIDGPLVHGNFHSKVDISDMIALSTCSCSFKAIGTHNFTSKYTLVLFTRR